MEKQSCICYYLCMKLNFKVNEQYLLFHSLSSRQPNLFSGWVNIKNKAWKKSPLAYSFFMGRPEFAFLEGDKESVEDIIKSFPEKAISVFNLVKDSKEFKRIVLETKKYKQFVANQWDANKNIVFKTLEELIGFALPKKTITVLITHPKLHNGISLSNRNIIGWGHKEDWKNYSVVYLAHEIMHSVMTEKLGQLGRNEISHAIIELITDNELRIRLSNKGIYFKENKMEVGHPDLRSIEKKILPAWKKYLKKKDKKIEEFYKEAVNILKKDIK